MRIALLLFLLFSPQSFPTPGPGVAPQTGGGGAPTITATTALCVGSASAAAANCTLGASGAVGDLLFVKSKSASVTNTATVAFTFSGTASCTPSTVVAPASAWQLNGTGVFIEGWSACIITTAGANIPVATWTGAGGTFTDIQAWTFHTTNTWKTTFLDQVSTPVIATVTATTCPTGTTAATTTANDLVIATCDVFNAGQTWGALAGFTNLAGASRNTGGVYYKSVTSTGTQTTTVPLSTTDFGVGIIAAFASN